MMTREQLTEGLAKQRLAVEHEKDAPTLIRGLGAVCGALIESHLECFDQLITARARIDELEAYLALLENHYGELPTFKEH